MAGEMNFGLLDTSAPERIARNALAARSIRQEQDMNALKMQEAQRQVSQRNALSDLYRNSGGDMGQLLQGLQQSGDYENAMQVQQVQQERQKAGLSLMPHVARILATDPSDANIDFLAGVYAQATGQDVSQFAAELKMKSPEERARVGVAIGQKIDPKFQVLNLGDRYQAVSVGPDGMEPIGQSMGIEKQPERGGNDYYQFLQSGDGLLVGNARTGGITRGMVDGKPVIGATADPKLQGEIAREKKAGAISGENQATAQADFPKIEAQTSEAIRLIDDLLESPGLKQATGTSRLLGIQKVPGTDAKDFDIRLDQLKGKQFLEAFQALKGGGQITEVEGKKATDALSRMNAEGSEEEFIKASKEFRGYLENGLKRAKAKAKGWTLHTDANGNKAYVSPDGTEFEEVQ